MALDAPDDDSARRMPIQAHRYPVWLVAFAIATLGAVFYSLIIIPPFLDAFVLMQRASSARKAGDPVIAEAQLVKVLQIFPTSKAARLDLAVMLLADPSDVQQLRGLDYLKGVTLDKYDWKRVSAVMPAKYLNLFSSTKK
jgi:hypothetical protein